MSAILEDCEIRQINPEAVARAAAIMPSLEVLVKAVEILKAGADLTRLRILMGLSTGELCVCDLAALTEVSESAVSHQLRDLKNANLVNSQKRGRMVYYHLSDHHVLQLLENAIEHAQETKIA
jgi:ArsR family transcriptional regulator, lead/cadmium/zinc/bismuth-responsive transcriptional repressor